MRAASEKRRARLYAMARLSELEPEVVSLQASLEAHRKVALAAIALIGDLVEHTGWLALPEADELVEAAFDDLVDLVARVGVVAD